LLQLVVAQVLVQQGRAAAMQVGTDAAAQLSYSRCCSRLLLLLECPEVVGCQ